MSKKVYDDDDGRTIADMSGIERRPAAGMFGALKKRNKGPEEETASTEEPPIDKKTRNAYTFGAVGAGLLIGLIYIAAFAVVIVIMLLIMGVL